MSRFEGCIYYAECEHRNPNPCGVAAPCSCFPGGDTDNCSVCRGKIWIYPSHPSKFENGHYRSRAKPNTLYIWELIYEYEAAEQRKTKTKTPGLR